MIRVGLDGAIAATIQVKTRTRGRDHGWMMNAKQEKIIRPHLFYAFVDFEQVASPSVFVIHSSVVADMLRRGYEAPGVAPSARRGSSTKTIRYAV